MSPEQPPPDDSPGPLAKEIGLAGVFSLAAGAMISSGLFILPGLAFAKAGPAVILSYASASLLVLPVMLSSAELATAMPRSGGTYFFIERSLGPLAGTAAGLANWLSIALKGAFALVGLGALAAEAARAALMRGGSELPWWLGPQGEVLTIKIVALTACGFFAAVNLVSVRHTGRLQALMVMGLLAMLGLFTAAGMGKVENTAYSPFVPFGWQAVFATSGMVFISFGGLTNVVSVSEEIRSPKKNIPLGMFLAFGVVSLLYVLVVFVTVGVVEKEKLAGSLMPIALAAENAMGDWGAVLVGAGAFLAFATTANSGILSASRSPLAMSRDGLLPAVFSRSSARFGTPYVSILITALFIGGIITFLSIEDLVKTASTMLLLTFCLVNVSVIIMRQSGLQNYRPTFRVPLYPWLPLTSTVVYGFLVFEMGKVPLLLTGAFVLTALVWYLAYVMPRIERNSALVYLVRNIVSSKIRERDLEEELKQITIERDEISHDRLDHLVKDAVVLDIEKRVDAPEMFRKAAEALAPRLGTDPERLFRLFIEREKESPTVVRPGLAIPHVIVEGKGLFQIALVRCREGAVFSDLHPPVTTAFILAGSKDERNFHLKALMAIAQIVEEEGFRERWMEARDAEALRDLVLLSNRQRET